MAESEQTLGSIFCCNYDINQTSIDEAFFKVSEHVFAQMFKGLMVVNYGICASMRYESTDLNTVLWPA